jgi:hypothetical protein
MWTQAKIYVAAGSLLVWSALLLCSGLYVGALAGRLGKANAEQRATADKLKAVLDGQSEANRRAEKLQKTLDRLPKSEGKQRDVVRANPAKCDRPAPVADGLRDAVREANRSRALPVDP